MEAIFLENYYILLIILLEYFTINVLVLLLK